MKLSKFHSGTNVTAQSRATEAPDDGPLTLRQRIRPLMAVMGVHKGLCHAGHVAAVRRSTCPRAVSKVWDVRRQGDKSDESSALSGPSTWAHSVTTGNTYSCDVSALLMCCTFPHGYISEFGLKKKQTVKAWVQTEAAQLNVNLSQNIPVLLHSSQSNQNKQYAKRNVQWFNTVT